MEALLIVIFVMQFLNSRCQHLLTNFPQSCKIQQNDQDEEKDSVRTFIIRLNEEKNERIKTLENRVLAMTSRSASTENGSELFKENFVAPQQNFQDIYTKTDVKEQNDKEKIELKERALDYTDIAINQTKDEIFHKIDQLNNSQEKLWLLYSSNNETIMDLYHRYGSMNRGIIRTQKRYHAKFEKLRTLEIQNNILNESVLSLEKAMHLKIKESVGYLQNVIKMCQPLEINTYVAGMVDYLNKNVFRIFLELYKLNNSISSLDEVNDNLEHINASLTMEIRDLEKDITVVNERCTNVQMNSSTSHYLLLQTIIRNRQLVRLVNGDTMSGILRVWIEDEWGNVCDHSFGPNEADVVCRQLGYSSGIVKRGAFFGSDTLKILMDNIDCVGTELAIQDCLYIGKNDHSCNQNEAVGVICS